MEFPDFPPKPPPTLEGLPIELCIQICLATNASGNFIFDVTSALNFCMASKTIYDKVHDSFLQRAVTCPKFSLTPWSLDVLVELLEHERMRKKVKALEFGPELLNTRLEYVLGLDTYGLRNDPPGNTHPYEWLNSSWPVWPVIRWKTEVDHENLLHVHWTSRYASNVWQWKHHTNYKKLCEEQKTRVTNRTHLADIIARFTNLDTITLDPRPVGPQSENAFETYIRPSIGTKTLVRAIGTHDMHLTHDPVPSNSILESSLSTNGLVLVEHGREYDLFSRLFKQLATPELEHIKLHLVLPGFLHESKFLHESSGFNLFGLMGESWNSLSHRVRSITLEFGAWKNYLSGSEVAWDWAHWAYHMLEDATAAEHLYVQNTPYSGCSGSGQLSANTALDGVAFWSNLRTLHFVRAYAGTTTQLLRLLRKYRDTLEDVQFQRVMIFGLEGENWENVLIVLRTMKRLQQLKLADLSMHSQVSIPCVPLGDNSVLMARMSGEGHESINFALGVAIKHLGYIGGYELNCCQYDYKIRFCARWPTAEEEHERAPLLEQFRIYGGTITA